MYTNERMVSVEARHLNALLTAMAEEGVQTTPVLSAAWAAAYAALDATTTTTTAYHRYDAREVRDGAVVLTDDIDGCDILTLTRAEAAALYDRLAGIFGVTRCDALDAAPAARNIAERLS